MINYLQYILPILFIIFGLVVKRSKDPRLASSQKIATILIILGIITLIGKIFIEYNKGNFNSF